MYTLSFSNKFKRDFIRCKKRNFPITKIEEIFILLAQTGTVPDRFKPHKLVGNYSNCWECHIESDWLLIWHPLNENEIYLIRTGTHSDLF